MGASHSRRKPPSRVTDHDRAVLQIKVQRDKLKQYQKRLSVDIEREVALAKEAARNGKRQQALLLLKRRKYQETLVERVEDQLLQLDEMVATIEQKLVEEQFVRGLEVGNEALKALNAAISIDDVDRLMADTAEAIEYQNEVSKALGAKLSPEDDAEAERELDAMLEHGGAADLAPAADATDAVRADLAEELPAVPASEPAEDAAVARKAVRPRAKAPAVELEAN